MSEGRITFVSDDSPENTGIHHTTSPTTQRDISSTVHRVYIKREPTDQTSTHDSAEKMNIFDNIKTEFDNQVDFTKTEQSHTSSFDDNKIELSHSPRHSPDIHTWRNIPSVYVKPELNSNYTLVTLDNTHTSFTPAIQPFECKQSSQRGNLTVHMRSHTGDKPYKCEQCGKMFTRKGDLTVHMRTHTSNKQLCESERPTCEQCANRFTTSGHLTVHMRTHTGERSYLCEQCGKRFTQSSHLTRHMRTHTGDKPYECKQCSKRFTRNGDLTVHMRTHTDDKPYKCEQCGKRFTQGSNLTVHMRTRGRTHTGKKPYKQ